MDFYGAGEDNGGRSTDSPPQLDFLPPNQQRQSTEDLF